MESIGNRTMKTVYTVVDRGPGKSFWVKLGVGFVNRDGSINLRLDAVPVNGTLQIRDYEPPPVARDVTDAERRFASDADEVALSKAERRPALPELAEALA